jgi:hypothetical protein
MWVAQWSGGSDEGLPITTGLRREDLGANWARVLLGGATNFQAASAFEQLGYRVLTIELHLLALAARRRAWLWVETDDRRLAVVTLGVVRAAAIVPSHRVGVLWVVP